jgi:hypothetical protein
VRENLSDKKKVSARKWQYFAEKKMLGNSFQVLFKERKNLEKQGREKMEQTQFERARVLMFIQHSRSFKQVGPSIAISKQHWD